MEKNIPILGIQELVTLLSDLYRRAFRSIAIRNGPACYQVQVTNLFFSPPKVPLLHWTQEVNFSSGLSSEFSHLKQARWLALS